MKIKVAHLQSAVIVPGIKSTEQTLSNNRVPGIEMDSCADGVNIVCRGAKGFIPWTNIKIVFFHIDEEEKPKSKAKFAEA